MSANPLQWVGRKAGVELSSVLRTRITAARHPGQAKREPGSQKGKRFSMLRSPDRAPTRLSGMTKHAIPLPMSKPSQPNFAILANGLPSHTQHVPGAQCAALVLK